MTKQITWKEYDLHSPLGEQKLSLWISNNGDYKLFIENHLTIDIDLTYSELLKISEKIIKIVRGRE